MALKEFQEYLKKFKYPNIEQMSEKEVVNTFSNPNRIYLLCWLVELIKPTLYLDPGSEDTPTIIANFIYEHGFCQKSQKDLFVSGDLPFVDQVYNIHICNC